MSNPRLADLKKIPSMGGHAIGEYLYELGRSHQGAGVVVEVGSWLGSSCAHLACGLQDAGSTSWIHCYDRFSANAAECEKARRQGVELQPGQDTTQLFLDNVLPTYPRIRAHRSTIDRIVWSGEPIEIYIDDAAKQRSNFLHVLRTFGPSFLPGLTTLVLMDFNMFRRSEYPPDKRRAYRAQQEILAGMSGHFERLRSDWPRTSMVSFKYVRRYDFGGLPAPTEAKTRRSVVRRLLSRLPGR